MAPRRMRVCMVVGTYPPARCGVGDALSILARNLARLGVEVSVVTSAYLGTGFHSSNPTVLPVVESWSLRNTRKVLKAVLGTRPDLVHFQWPTTEYARLKLFDFLPPVIKFVRPSTRVVITFHELVPLKRQFGGFFRPRGIWACVRWANGIIVVAESYGDALRAACPTMSRIPIKLVRNATNIPASTLSFEQLRELRIQLGIAPGTLLLSYFGFIHPGKGLECLLGILKVLWERGVAARLIILGFLSESNTYHQRLLSRIQRDGLREQITLAGYSDDKTVANWLAASDACIFPFTEGLHPKAVSILAATIQGVFTVTTSTEQQGLNEAQNVYYARPGDIEDMVAAVQRYAGRKSVHGSFPWRTSEQVAQDNLEFYEQLLSCRKPGRPRQKLYVGSTLFEHR